PDPPTNGTVTSVGILIVVKLNTFAATCVPLNCSKLSSKLLDDSGAVRPTFGDTPADTPDPQELLGNLGRCVGFLGRHTRDTAFRQGPGRGWMGGPPAGAGAGDVGLRPLAGLRQTAPPTQSLRAGLAAEHPEKPTTCEEPLRRRCGP